ncbi:MAG TPA: ATP-binding protein [Chitinophagaceae bacterium]|nr:ATP-binding protein [Chitinophagaceae bacterium]
MNTQQQPEQNGSKIPEEFTYIYDLFVYRLSKHFGKTMPEPPMPRLRKWSSFIRTFVENELKLPGDAVFEAAGAEKEVKFDMDAARLLLIALIPFAIPDLYDRAIADAASDLSPETAMKKSGKNDFPKMGGIHGVNYRGFLPTGQTALFLLAGDDYLYRRSLHRLFDADHVFVRKKIIWLEELSAGEPFIHGRLIMSQDYVDLLLFGKNKPPHFSTSFPAKKIETDLIWEDLVINNEQREQIEEIRTWINYNDKLTKEWKWEARCKTGYKALFYGPPGTGKTLTASLIGKYAGMEIPDAIDECGHPRSREELESINNKKQKDVFRVDLSMVVSKYIGETEKNLSILFARAEDKGWILFFDEADALFGKRTGVRDAHDKYANQEVSYLLQRLEEYRGLVILSSNFKSNIDEAFLRRFNSVVKFHLPDTAERVAIWKRTFPRDTIFLENIDALPDCGIPESIDIYPLIKKYELSGGGILNVVHYASLKGIKGIEERNKKAVVPAGHEEEEEDHSKEDTVSKPTIFLNDIVKGIQNEMIKEGKPFEYKG